MKKIPLVYLFVFICFIHNAVVADERGLSKTQQLFSECQIPSALSEKFTAMHEHNQRLRLENAQIQQEVQAMRDLLGDMQTQVQQLLKIQQKMSLVE